MSKLEEIRQHAKNELKHCPYCIQHDEEFISRFPHMREGVFVFSSSPAFKVDGRWYHLQLCKPQQNSRGGYNWQECSQAEHHEYIAIVDGKYFTLADATEYARRYMEELESGETEVTE